MGTMHLAKEERTEHESVSSLMGRTRNGFLPIRLELITIIEAAGSLTMVHTSEGSFTLRQTLTALTKVLPSSMFARMNRSLILNISQIAELQVLGGDGNQLLMKDGRIITLTRQLSEMESLLRHAAS